MNLIAAQDSAIARILALPVADKRGGFMGKSVRALCAIRNTHAYRLDLLGFTKPQIRQSWDDIKDIALLNHNAAN